MPRYSYAYKVIKKNVGNTMVALFDKRYVKHNGCDGEMIWDLLSLSSLVDIEGVF